MTGMFSPKKNQTVYFWPCQVPISAWVFSLLCQKVVFEEVGTHQKKQRGKPFSPRNKFTTWSHGANGRNVEAKISLNRSTVTKKPDKNISS